MSAVKDITGRRFGRLVALRPQGKNVAGNVRWLCQCDCGRQCEALGVVLRKGTKTSCGCARHGHLRRRPGLPNMAAMPPGSSPFGEFDEWADAAISHTARTSSRLPVD